MNALNEVNKVITGVSYYTHRGHSQLEEDEWLTAEKMAVSIMFFLRSVIILVRIPGTYICMLEFHLREFYLWFQEWIQQNNVLSIVLRDSLHQPQYVEKLEKIIRFMIKENALTSQDLDKIWEAQVLFTFTLLPLL